VLGCCALGVLWGLLPGWLLWLSLLPLWARAKPVASISDKINFLFMVCSFKIFSARRATFPRELPSPGF
jgi:hypothetical protein